MKNIPVEKENIIINCMQWYLDLSKTTNKIFMPFYSQQKRYLVLMGGAGSGKSIFAGRKLLERITSEEQHRILVLRKVARTLRESCFSQLVSQISEHYNIRDFNINKTDMSITYLNKSKLIFAGLDDNEKLKSIYNITGIWVEEASEITEADFNQLDIRLRGFSLYYKQIILTFNPININHWLKRRFFDDYEAIKKDCVVNKSTYLDNRFLDEAAKNVLLAYKDSDEYYYNVYALGNWGVYGKSIFNVSALYLRLNTVSKLTFLTGDFCFKDAGANNAVFISDSAGSTRIYSKPKPNKKYVIGADTAGEGSDFFVAQVVDLSDYKQVCTLRGHFDEDLFAYALYALGKYYNDALIAVETNFSTYPVKKLTELNYTNQFVRIAEDSFSAKPIRSYGFKTTSVTRPLIIAGLKQILRDVDNVLYDVDTINELLTFTLNERLRPEAAPGCHDDTVMSLAIAYYAADYCYNDEICVKSDKVYNFEFEKDIEEQREKLYVY